MEVSKLTITGETMEKATKQLNNRQKGELRSKKLKELADSGRLAMIKNRPDLAEAVGYSQRDKNFAGYSWVQYKVDKGVLEERLVGFNNNGRAEYEYIYHGEPKPAERKYRKSQPVVEPTPVNEMLKAAFKEEKSPTLTIYKGDMTISLENITAEMAADIIKSIME